MNNEREYKLKKWLEVAQKRDAFLAECDKLDVTYNDDGSVLIEVETKEGV